MITPELPNNELERLEALRKLDVLDSINEQDFDDITSLAAEICKTPISVISLVDENRQWFKSVKGLNVHQTSRDVSFCGHAINNPTEVLIIKDARNDIRFNDNPLVTDSPNIVFYAGAPIIDDDGFALGTLCVIDNESRELGNTQLMALKTLARNVYQILKLRHQTKIIDSDRNFLIESLDFSSPFFMIIDKEMKILKAGKNYAVMLPSFNNNSSFNQLFDWAGKFDVIDFLSSKQGNNYKLLFFSTKDKKQKFKCSVKKYNDNSFIVFAIPVINTEFPISNYNLKINNFPAHDYIAEYLFLQQAATKGLSDSRLLNTLLSDKNKELELSKKALISSNNILEERLNERTKKIKHLALFPEQNPNPVLELDYKNNEIVYLNPRAKDLFNSIENISFLKLCEILKIENEDFLHKTKNLIELNFDDKIFQRNINYLNDIPHVRLYLHDITEIRKTQREDQERQTVLANLRSISLDNSFNEKVKIITRSASKILNPDRCSVWLFSNDKSSIVTDSVYTAKNDNYLDGMELKEIDFPSYFNGLFTQEIIFAPDATQNTYTSCFTDVYLNPLGIRSMLDIPIINSGEVIGVLCNEYFNSVEVIPNNTVNFARSIADIIALYYESDKLKTSQQSLKEKNDSLQEAYQKLIKMQDEIVKQEKMASLGTLVAGIAHEINTPLGAIKASNEIVSNGLLDNLNLLNSVNHPDDLTIIFKLSSIYLKQNQLISTREQREITKNLNLQLSQLYPELIDSSFFAKKIYEFGYTNVSEVLTEFLVHPRNREIFTAASELVNLKRSAENIRLAVDKASRVVKSLNHFSHSNLAGDFGYFKLKENFENVITILWNKIKQGSKIELNIEDHIEIFGNQDEIAQVWTNIINNALHACNNKAEIKINHVINNEFHEISIHNNGPKIPDDVLDKIFEPFFSTKKAGEGTGLGLHIVKKIIEGHSGEIVCKSTDTLTSFTFKIPVLAPIKELNDYQR